MCAAASANFSGEGMEWKEAQHRLKSETQDEKRNLNSKMSYLCCPWACIISVDSICVDVALASAYKHTQTETWVCISVFLLTVTITSPFGNLYLMLIKRPQLLITQPVAVLPLRLHFSLNVRGSIISITAQNRILYVLMWLWGLSLEK